MKRTGYGFVLALLAVAGLAAWQEVQPQTTGVICIVPIDGEINYAQSAFIHRAVAEAKERKAAAVVFEIDSPGGELGAMFAMGEQIRSLPKASIRTIAFVRPRMGGEAMGAAYSAAAFLSICCEKIYMSPGTVIGAAAPIMVGPEGPVEVGEKFVSATRGKFRAIAQENGHPANLAEAMVDKELEVVEVEVEEAKQYLTRGEIEEIRNQGGKLVEIKVVNPEGKILTLSQQEAVHTGLAKEATAREGIYRDLNMIVGSEVAIAWTWSEELVGFLTTGIVRTLLLIAGILGIWIELKTPGFGFPGILGIVSFAALLFGHNLAGLAGATEILLIVVGVALLIVEIFLLPGFGIFGVAGFVCFFIGIVLSLQYSGIPVSGSSWEVSEFFRTSLNVFGGLAGAVVGFLIFLRILPGVPLANRMVLAEALTAAGGVVSPSQEASEALVGKTGIALTPLRPAGKIDLGGKFYDVVTDGDFAAKGEPVTIIQIDGSRIVVRRRV